MKKLPLIIFLFLLFAAPKAHAAVAFVASSTSGEVTAAAATTTSFTVSGSNPVIVVETSHNSAATTTAVSWSLGGTATEIVSLASSSRYSDIWCIIAPTAGTGTVHATFGASINSYLVAAAFSGANQTNPCPTANAISTSTSIATTTLKLTAGGLTTGDASVMALGLFNSGDIASPYVQPNTIYHNVGGTSDNEMGYATSTASLTGNWESSAGSLKIVNVIRIQQAPTVAATGTPALFIQGQFSLNASCFIK